MQPICFFDLETRARPDALAALDETLQSELEAVTAPANWKDETKIAAYIAERRAGLLTKARAEAALDPDTAEIAAVGFRLYPNWDTQALAVTPTPTGEEESIDEADLLIELWSALAEAQGRCAGYNVLGFDLPMLQRRSMALGLTPPLTLTPRRYATEPVTDLMEIYFNWGRLKYKGLKTVARLNGLPNPLPSLDGSAVAQMDRGTLLAYVANDVNLVTALWERMDGVYWPRQRPLTLVDRLIHSEEAAWRNKSH